MTTTTVDPLAYYAAHGCALFPIPAGQKHGHLVPSFKHDHSADPAQWAAWRTQYPGCNFGVVAFASRLIIADTDTSGGEEGRAEAWALRWELLSSWGIDPTTLPHCQSQSGGWHDYFSVPADVDASTLRQPDAIKKRINLRCVGFTVAAGSQVEGRPYILLTDAPPHPAPAALVEFCKRKANPKPAGAVLPGSRDRNDVAGLLTWLNERGAFGDYESWFQVGMALKLEYGDDGFALWELTHDETVTPDTATTKWESFATDPDGNSVTLNTFLQRAHALGWRGTVRKSTASMFDGVAQLAAMSGASLASNMPLPPDGAGPVPMLGGQEELARLAAPMLQEFLDATTDAPAQPANTADLPTLPPQMSGHGLFDLMSQAITRIFALAEQPKLKAARLNDPLSVLHQMHADVFESVCRNLRNRPDGITLQDRKIKNGSAALQEAVERVTVTHDKWEYDAKGEIQSDNPDNVVVLLGVLGLELRWNLWLERMEIQGGNDPAFRWYEWTYIDDTIVAALLTRAKRTKTRFRPGKDFMWETLLTLSHQNDVDPVCDTLDALAAAWDRTPRLITWLARYCGTPCDTYHQAVGKLIIGGMVKRARHPGCKFDFMPIFYGKQGTSKSTMAAILADMGQTPVWQIELGQGQNFTDNVLLGDAAKELVLALAGQLVAEIGEMGMRSNTNTSHVKAMISRQIDAGRTAYARAISKRPRRNIFIGTTNDAQPLSDPTGNRRFLPIRITQEIDLAGFAAEIKQLVGEAATLETAGADFRLPREVWGVAAEYQENARQASDLEVLFTDWFGGETAAFVTMPDVVKLCDATGRKNAGQAVYSIMERLGFKETSPNLNGKKTRVWYRSQFPKGMLPKHVAGLPQYQIDTTSHSPRVVLRMAATAGAVAMPPIPSSR